MLFLSETYAFVFIMPHYIILWFTGDRDIKEKQLEPVKVHSEKELVREFEKVAFSLNPEKDWSIRIAAMQKIEALVYGGLYLSPPSTSVLYSHMGITLEPLARNSTHFINLAWFCQ